MENSENRASGADVDLSRRIALLKEQLDALATEPDDALAGRYRLRGSMLPQTPYWLLRRFASAGLRWFSRLRLGRAGVWPARLKHVDGDARARPLLIWAVGAEPATLRAACDGIAVVADTLPDFAPVLITDVADFAYFARLGWLVEFLPAIDGEGEPYETRKARLLARLYRGAPVLPVEAGLGAETRADEVRSLVARGWND